MIKHIKNLTLFVVAALAITACTEELERADLISFQGATVGVSIPIPGTSSVEVKVYTTTKAGSDRTFSLVVDPSSTANPENYTVPASVVIPANTNVGTFTVGATASFIDAFLLLRVEPIGSTIAGPPIRVNILGLCEDPNVILEFEFDGYASETSWTITTSGGVTVKSVAAGTYTDGQVDATEGVCLPSGDYSLTVYDAWGDGLSFPFDGSFTLKLSDGTVLGSDVGDFGASSTVDFTVP
ncbi:MAG: hypothetical protein KF845_15915 [Cyclobacteriaceae bacterium]|nr:hypothetical protein [Cyclobacteriaceae bacterium]